MKGPRGCAVAFVAACEIAIWPPPACALENRQLGVIVNTWDPLSVKVGEYYAAKRRIPFSTIIKVGIAPDRAALTRKEFEALKQ